MAVRSTRLGVEVAQQQPGGTRATRLGVEVAQQQPANTRATRLGVEVAQQRPANTRATRLSVQVAIGAQSDPVIRGLRRAGVIHHRQPNEIARA